MDLEKAKEIMTISENEKASLDRYQGFLHAALNTLIEIDPSDYEKINKEYLLPQNKKDFKERIDDFVNINSAIYKYYKNHFSEAKERTLYRAMDKGGLKCLTKGKNNNEVITTTSFLSTCNELENLNIPATGGYTIKAELTISENVPFMNMEEYLNGKCNEHEILLPPFLSVSKVEDKKFNKNILEFEVDKEKREDKNITKKEIKEREDKLGDDFEQYIKALKRDVEIPDEIVRLNAIASRTTNREDSVLISKDLDKYNKEYDENNKIINEFQKEIKELLEDKCYVIEKEIDVADNIVKEDLRVQLEEKRRRDALTEYNDYISATKDRALDFDDTLVKEYDSIIANEEALRNKRIMLGLLNKENVYYEIGSDIAEIFCCIEEINQKADELYLDVDDKENSIEKMNSKRGRSKLDVQNSLYNRLNINDFVKASTRYKDARTHELQKDIYVKAYGCIKNAKMNQLNSAIEIKQGEKIGFFDKLFGKEKLKNIELENLMLKKQKLDLEDVDIDNLGSCDIKDTLADLYKTIHMDVSDAYSGDANKFYKKLIKEFYPNNADVELEIYQRAKDKFAKENTNVALAVDVRKESTKEKVARLKEENNELNTSIIQLKHKPNTLRVFDSSSSLASKKQMKFIVEGYTELLKKSALLNNDSQIREENIINAIKEKEKERIKSKKEKEIEEK